MFHHNLSTEGALGKHIRNCTSKKPHPTPGDLLVCKSLSPICNHRGFFSFFYSPTMPNWDMTASVFKCGRILNFPQYCGFCVNFMYVTIRFSLLIDFSHETWKMNKCIYIQIKDSGLERNWTLSILDVLTEMECMGVYTRNWTVKVKKVFILE